METKKTETLKKVYNSDELVEYIDWYLAENALKRYTKTLTNEVTGEIEQIEKTELLFEKGTKIEGDIYPKINFALQSGDLESIIISNQCRVAEEKYKGISVYFALVEIDINGKTSKARLLFFAESIPQAIEMLKDYIELNYTGSYRIINVKEYNTDLLFQSEEKEESEKDEYREYIFYNILASTVNKDDPKYIFRNLNAVIKAYEIDSALKILDNWAQNFYKDMEEENFILKLREAKIITANEIIPRDFSLAYCNINKTA